MIVNFTHQTNLHLKRESWIRHKQDNPCYQLNLIFFYKLKVFSFPNFPDFGISTFFPTITTAYVNLNFFQMSYPIYFKVNKGFKLIYIISVTLTKGKAPVQLTQLPLSHLLSLPTVNFKMTCSPNIAV